MSVEQAGGAAGVPRRSFAARVGAALRLRADLFEEIEHDPSALPQAALVVLAGGLARGIGALPEEGWLGLLSVVFAVVLWFCATAAVTAIGVRIFHDTSNFEELLRTLGFAAAPLVILVLRVIPLGAGRDVVFWVGHGLAVAALVVAVRQALDTHTRHALWVCACALGLGIAVLLILGLLFLGRAAF